MSIKISYNAGSPTNRRNHRQPIKRPFKWAESGMAAAVKAGIVSGVSKSQIAPVNNATRAQAAEMISKMLFILAK